MINNNENYTMFVIYYVETFNLLFPLNINCW